MADEFNAFGEKIAQAEPALESLTQVVENTPGVTQTIDSGQNEQFTNEEKMIQAYVTITEQMGPSAQLLAFINFDGKLGEELGVALESLSVVDQHQLLLASIKSKKAE